MPRLPLSYHFTAQHPSVYFTHDHGRGDWQRQERRAPEASSNDLSDMTNETRNQ